jgi:hypothetical protein
VHRMSAEGIVFMGACMYLTVFPTCDTNTVRGQFGNTLLKMKLLSSMGSAVANGVDFAVLVSQCLRRFVFYTCTHDSYREQCPSCRLLGYHMWGFSQYLRYQDEKVLC